MNLIVKCYQLHFNCLCLHKPWSLKLAMTHASDVWPITAH